MQNPLEFIPRSVHHHDLDLLAIPSLLEKRTTVGDQLVDPALSSHE
jgi:hypothetical protein